MLPEDATDAGLLGVSFFGGRGLSMPFSGGEWAGLARGVAGSWRNIATIRLTFVTTLTNISLNSNVCHFHYIYMPLSSPHWTRLPPGHHFSLHHCPVKIFVPLTNLMFDMLAGKTAG